MLSLIEPTRIAQSVASSSQCRLGGFPRHERAAPLMAMKQAFLATSTAWRTGHAPIFELALELDQR